MPRSKYVVEVLTDNPIDGAKYLEDEFVPDHDPGTFNLDDQYRELLTPKDYQTSTGAKYKSRALHYAIESSMARGEDWIIHLDEETRMNKDTIANCLWHCVCEDEKVKLGQKKFGDIGQGVILYGCQTSIENYITTLADSYRVGDDFGKFRVQYLLHSPWIGMHGSFVVVQNAVEKLIGFDNGLVGSITEDTYFALLAWQAGVAFSWIDTFMYEQSPFSLKDFVMQRRRWFGGLLLCCQDQSIGLRYRVCLYLMMTSWTLCIIPVLVNYFSGFISVVNSGGFGDPHGHDEWVGIYSNMKEPAGYGTFVYWYSIALGAINSVGYLLGFVKTFDIGDGPVRYFVLLFLQLMMMPIFATMEALGVITAIISPPVSGFHVVQKESGALKKRISEKDLNCISEADTNNFVDLDDDKTS